MSFGFGVGDFLAVINLANKIRKDFSGAPEQLQTIAAEVRSLAGILQDVDTFLAGHEIISTQEERLGAIEENCRKVLDDINKFVNKNSSLQKDKSGSKERFKRTWQRVKWDPSDTQDLRQRLTSNLAALNSFTASITSENVVQLVVRQKHEQNQEILEWLAPSDYAAQHSDHLRRRLAGTGGWLVESSEYQNWLHKKGQMLLLHGIPGAGKTTLSAMIVDSLQNQCQAEESHAVCYFYFDYKRHKEQQVNDVMLCLLRQLVEMVATLPLEIQHLYDQHRKHKTRLTLDNIKVALIHILKSFSMGYIVIDALDECQTTDSRQRDFIDAIVDLHKSSCVNVIATSRPIPNIQSRFSSYESLEIRASSSDIGKYIDENLKNLPGFVTNNLDLQQEIKSKVTSSVDGILDERQEIRNQLRRMLASLSSGPNSYGDAYTKTMEGLQSQVQDQVEVATEILMWVAYAQRPLRSAELLNALAVEPETEEFDEDNIPDLDDIISACCGLIVIEAGTGLVRLVHYTTQEFFDSETGRLWLEGAQHKLANNCITYLSYNHFSNGICKDSLSFGRRLENYPFYEYSSQFWGEHARLSGNSALASEFLGREQQLQASSQILVIKDVDKGIPLFFLTEEVFFLTPLSLIAHFGLQDMVHGFLDELDVNAMDDKSRTPLSYAAANGQTNLVQLLIKKGANVESRDQDDMTPLLWAAHKGQLSALLSLLDNGASIDGDLGARSLRYAASSGHNTILEALLKRVDVQACVPKDITPLHAAAIGGHENTVEFLISKGAQVNDHRELGSTPLMAAVACNHLSTAALLLKKGAKINARDNEGMTSLMMGCRNIQNSSMVKLLLDHGSETAAVDDNGYSALHHAAVPPVLYRSSDNDAGHMVDNVRQLLDHGAELIGKTKDNKTALSLAVQSGNLDVVKVLMNAYDRMDWKIDFLAVLDIRDHHGRNILHYIAIQHDVEFFKQFLPFDLRTRLHDKHGKSVLDYAINSCSEQMVLSVLDNIAVENLSPAPSSTWSPLHWACRQGNFAIVEMLVKKGYTTSTVKTAFPVANWTPLDVAAYHQNINLIDVTSYEPAYECNWYDVLTSGIVDQVPGSNKIVRRQANSLRLPTSGSHQYTTCDGCQMAIQPTCPVVLCHKCGERYCFMCAKDTPSTRVKDFFAYSTSCIHCKDQPLSESVEGWSMDYNED